MSYTKTNWEALPSTNTPIIPANLNKIETELETLDKNITYLTTEQPIGTYIDGKTIYRKVINTLTPASESSENLVSLNASLENLINLYGNVQISSLGLIIPINIYVSSSENILVYYDTINGVIHIGAKRSDYLNKPITIIIEYTKTTD